MTKNVTDLTEVREKREKDLSDQRILWECRCGNKTFILYADGDCECSFCKTVATGTKCYDVPLDEEI